MKIKTALVYLLCGVVVCLVGAAAIFGPAELLRRYDAKALGSVTLEEKDVMAEGYKYVISPSEKLYVLSNALNNRIIPQSDYFAMIRSDSLSDVRTQSYAFQPVYNESEFNDETRAAALLALEAELHTLSTLGIVPQVAFEPQGGDYEADLYTAIDVLEPKLSATVWQISFNGVIIRQGLVECVMDAQTHKIYSIAIRSDQAWEEYDTQRIVALWAEYLGVGAPQSHDVGGALAESASYYQKYAIPGVEDDHTLVTVGYYEGIKEFFIRISTVS